MKRYHYFRILMICMITVSAASGSVEAIENSSMQEETQKNQPPQFLYKVLSMEDWKGSESQNQVKLSKSDTDFIHLSTEDQLDRIVQKYYSDVPEYVVLKIETQKLPGKLVFEANPGGVNKYYHLYDGAIPKSAVVNAKIIKK
ncbi:MAG: DUF952 domain-containing protein [Chlamydiales bacterium]